MNKLIVCNNCKEVHWTQDECAPVWMVEHEEYAGDELQEVRSSSAESAAEKYALIYNSDLDMMDGNDIKIAIIRSDGTRTEFSVSACPTIIYHAEKIKL